MASAAVSSENTVKKIYLTVIDEVLANVREAFLDEGCDEQLLQELRHMWETKLNASRALQSQEEHASHGNNDPPAGSKSNGNGTASGGSGLRLPTTPATPSRENHTSSRSASAASNPSDVKGELDPATRSALQALPPSMYSSSGNHSSNGKKLMGPGAPQLDGGVDGSSSDDDDDDEIGADSIHGDEEDEDADDKTNNDDQSEHEGKEDPDPLNSDDDLTDQGSPDSNSDLFDTENVIVCQYDKITRIKNRWKFHLKDGIMNINGKDYLFSKANGDAEW